MADYVISTDSTASLPTDYTDKHNVILQDLGFSFGEKLYSGVREMDAKTFYAKMRNGEVAKTNASIPEHIKASFEAILKEGKDILHLGFSSGLSSSYQNAVMIANDLSEEYPDRKIIVIDSLCACLGQGLFVYYAVKNKENGMGLEENAKKMEDLKLHVCHEFTVEDLKYLARGGRISKTTALIGNIINLKPVLHVDNEGHLISVGKVRGRKQSLNALVDNMGKHFTKDYENEIIFICHGDCEEDAQYVADLVKAKFGIDNFLIGPCSPTIGAHSGPGTVALFYIGKER